MIFCIFVTNKVINAMNSEELTKKIARFNRVCLFGAEADDYIAAALRAYRDFCRTIEFIDKKDKNSHDVCRADVAKLIADVIQNAMPNDTQKAYDEFHFALCVKIIEEYKDKRVAELTFGQAQKWVNMTMKYLCVLSGGNFTENYEWLAKFYPYLHVPIDSIILAEAEKAGYIFCKSYPCWSKLDKNQYLEIQGKLRMGIDKIHPMDWEFDVWGNNL